MNNKNLQTNLEQLLEFEKKLNSDLEINESEFTKQLHDLINILSKDLSEKQFSPKLKIKVKKINKDAVIPKYAKHGDAGLDLTATSIEWDEYGNAVYGVGLAVEIPYGYVGLLFPRSSIFKVPLTLSNSVGVIDSGYRGEIMMKFKPTLTFNINNEITSNKQYKPYDVGERIGQLLIIPYPQIELEMADELSDSERGTGGYGSTNI